jgi:hypothetical protein
VSKLWLLGLAALVVAAVPATGRSGGAAACARGAVVLRIDTNGAGGRVLVYASLVNTGRTACVARGRLRVSLRAEVTSRLLAVTGNPYAATVRHVLRRGRNNLYTLEWRNYCGPVVSMRFELTFWKTTAQTGSSYPAARCEDLDSPSRLRLLRRA